MNKELEKDEKRKSEGKAKRMVIEETDGEESEEEPEEIVVNPPNQEKTIPDIAASATSSYPPSSQELSAPVSGDPAVPGEVKICSPSPAADDKPRNFRRIEIQEDSDDNDDKEEATPSSSEMNEPSCNGGTISPSVVTRQRLKLIECRLLSLMRLTPCRAITSHRYQSCVYTVRLIMYISN